MRKLTFLFLLVSALPASAQWGTGASAGTFNFYISGVAAALSDSARLKAGSNVTITKSGNEVTIAANAGSGITPAGARQHTGWTAQGGLIASDTVATRIEWGGTPGASIKVFDADGDTVIIKPQQNNAISVKAAGTVKAGIDTLGRITSGGSFNGNSTASLDGSTPQIQFQASDGDVTQIAANTSDQIIFNKASGGVVFKREQATDIDTLIVDPYGATNGLALRYSDAGTVLFSVDTTGTIKTASVDSNSIKSGSLNASAYRTASVGAAALAPTAVTAGSYTSTNLTVDADGRITAASNGTGGSGITPAGARQHTGWTAQGAAIAKDTVVARIEWGGTDNASMKIFDADNDSVKFIPQSLSPIAVTDGATVLFNVDSTGNVGLGTATFGTNATQTLAITNGTAPASSPANTFQLYSGSGEANIRDANGLVSTLTHEYGTLVRNSNTTIVLATNSYAKVTFNTALTTQGLTAVTDSITIVRAGVYQVFFNMSATTAAGSDAYDMSIFINQSQSSNAQTLAQLTTTSTSIFTMFQFALSAGDDIAVMIKNTTDGDDITISRASLIITRID